MRRDMELIRLLLLEAEGEEKVDLSNYSEKAQLYHTAQMIDAKLVIGSVVHNHKTAELTRTIVQDLTWAGHDFLAAARSENVWKKAMAKVKSTGVDVSISLMKELLTSITKTQLGIAP